MANDITDSLMRSAAEFIEHYKEHPSYRDAVYKLKQAVFEIDLLNMSPGRQAARAAGQPNQTGQEVSDGNQEPSLQGQ